MDTISRDDAMRRYQVLQERVSLVAVAYLLLQNEPMPKHLDVDKAKEAVSRLMECVFYGGQVSGGLWDAAESYVNETIRALIDTNPDVQQLLPTPFP